MKQTKWQRLATIGLCSSLVINAFSGVTAVAETVTIESSPTVASSANEATSASSATQASTESSQETTETSREEVTQETEKPEVVEEETEAKKQEEETVTSEVVQPNPVLAPTPVSGIGVRAGNLAETYQYFLEIQKKFQINGSQAQVVTPNIAIGVNLTSSEGATVNIDDFELRSTVRTSTSLWDPSYGGYRTSYSTPENISSTKLTNSIQMNIPSKILRAQANATYTIANYSFYLEDVSLSVPKYISNVFVGEPLAIKGIRVGAFAIPTTATLDIKKINQETYKLETNPNTGNAGNVFSTAVSHSLNRSEFGTVLAEKDLELSVVFKKVTESFKDTAGATIPAPTGFTQGKQTSITSNNYTFKQAGTLPETYKASNGKTYKFKGWYKGKTKPNTLTTTKAPSYAVTYDDNDDLNVVYEEANFPAVTYQFGFVNEAGQLVNPADIKITYDYKSLAFRGQGGGANDTASYSTIATNQSAATVGNLKNVTLPATYIARPTETGTNDDMYSNFSIKLPRYYQSLNLYDKTNKIDPKYPLPTITLVQSSTGNTVRTEAQAIADLTLTQRADKSFTPAETYKVVNPSVKYPRIMDRKIYSANLSSGNLAYWNVGSPIYYHLTNRKVTENFVDTNGAKITPPTGFTQGKQTAITSDPYTFKQAGTLPDTYTTGGKTYKFKGWYKGKTKPSTLTTTKAPSYAVTYDGNDDLNVVYEEVVTKTYTLPSKEITFGYVDEKGNLINPANFTLKATMSETTKSGKTTPLPTITGTNVTTTNLKKLTIPQKVYTLPEPIDDITYGTRSVTHEIPKYYRTIALSPTATYTGDKTKYPLANEVRKEVANPSTVVTSKPGTNIYDLIKTSNTSYYTRQFVWKWDATKVPYAMGVYSGNAGGVYDLATPDKTVYYYLENRRVTENFVDTSGAKITPPTGFTQGKKTAITSDAYTFKQAGTLPDTYTTGGKTYKFKGWYKGKTKPSTLTTTKAPSYGVTYDDNDDLNVVYEEVRAFDFPAETFQFGFVGEDGKLANPADINITYNHTGISFRRPAGVDPSVSYKTIAANQSGTTVGNFKQVIFPATTIERPTTTGWNGDIFSDFSIKLPKYYESLNLYDKTGKIGTNYPLPKLAIISTIAPDNVFTEAGLISNLTLTQREDRSYTPWEINVTIDSSVKYPNIMSRSINSLDESNGNIRYKTIEGPIYYHLTNRKVTENFVDANGTKITAPTGFTQGNQVPMNSNTFNYTAAQALPATYTAGGKTYTFQGWYKGKTKPSTLNKTTTPTFNATFDGNDDMTAMYKEEIPMASVTLTRPKEVIDTNTNVIWTTTITNTSKAPLQNLTLKKGPNWSAGLTIPTFMEVTPEGETTKSIPVNSTLWTDGVPVPNAVPVGKKVSIAFTTRATGRPNTVLKAEVVVFGGIKDRTVDNFVRIRPNDQEVVTPTTEGFISVPTFDFGQVGVAGSKQQHSLKQTADYYGNGTRNPYVRIKKTQPNWSLTAQLSQPKSATDSLPTATRLLLGAAPVSSFSNYNQPTELKNAVGTTSAISLNANNTATVTWNLVTGP
ncbi:WxL domain-containing protein [Enterococcus faecalis]|uniref:WxL domain-containing protein n=1 Tax=Enterococcus faecalis TaxID=1351 RepID=UPI0029C81EE6|nr:WxL domain-containing protein [Enterococcus faecalis]WPH52111.1 WxL domain-containing protein [Enterococcus faecalis]